MTMTSPRLVSVSFSCLMCGLDTQAIEIRVDALSRAAVRRALEARAPEFQPEWDEALTPHCPRCRGRLLLELRSVPAWRQREAARGAAR